MPGQAAQKAATKRKKEKAQVAQQIVAALVWCAKTRKGTKAALATKQFPLLTRGILDYALKHDREKVTNPEKFTDATRYAGNSLLTDAEEKELLAWFQTQNKKLDGKEDEDLGMKVVAILKARQNVRNLLHGRRAAPLSTVAKECVKRGMPSEQWFKSFANRHADAVKRKRPTNINTKRATKAKFSNATKMLTEGKRSLYYELTELPDEKCTSLVGTVHPVTNQVIRPIIDPKIGEFTMSE